MYKKALMNLNKIKNNFKKLKEIFFAIILKLIFDII